MVATKNSPSVRKGVRFPFQTAVACWIDVLGYGGMIRDGQYNPLDQKSKKAIRPREPNRSSEAMAGAFPASGQPPAGGGRVSLCEAPRGSERPRGRWRGRFRLSYPCRRGYPAVGGNSKVSAADGINGRHRLNRSQVHWRRQAHSVESTESVQAVGGKSS